MTNCAESLGTLALGFEREQCLPGSGGPVQPPGSVERAAAPLL